ncbi:MAG: hypothetical protein RML15_08275 [Bacteroidota bacterium]|nr:hypothetical protein [Bacteroidota bacterium]
MRWACSAWMLIASTAVVLAQRIEISGRILDARGNPLAVAHAELRRAGRLEPIVQVRANPDGSFALAAEGEGLFLLRLAGVHHRPVDVPLVVGDAPVRERVTVRLATLPLPERRDSVLIAPERTLPETPSGVLLTLREGLYVLPGEVAAPQRYRIVLRGGGRGVVTASVRDSLVLQPDGYYSGILRDSSFVFDPAELPRPNDAAVVRCESSAWQEVADAYLAFQGYLRAFADTNAAMMERAARAGGLGYDPVQVHAAVGAERWRDTIVARLASVRTRVAEQLWLLFALALPARGSGDELHRRALQQIPPSSPLWALDPQLVFQAVAQRDESDRRAFLDAVVETNPDTTARAVVAFTELVAAFNSGDRERARAMYKALTTHCVTHPLARTAQRYNPDRRIQRGAELPAFRLPGKRKGSVVTRQDVVSGQPLLVAVVFNDCRPCIEQLQGLAAWRDSTKQSLRLLVVSIGEPAGELQRVLERLPHTLAIAPGFDAPELAPFEIEGYPTFILTNSRGIIVATNNELRTVRTDVDRFLDAQP